MSRITIRAILWTFGLLVLLGATTVWRSIHHLPFEPSSPADELNAGLMRPHLFSSDSLNVEQIAVVLADRLDPISPGQIPFLAEHISILLTLSFRSGIHLSMIQVESGFRYPGHVVCRGRGADAIMPATAGVVFGILPFRSVRFSLPR